MQAGKILLQTYVTLNGAIFSTYGIDCINGSGMKPLKPKVIFRVNIHCIKQHKHKLKINSVVQHLL